MAFKKRSTERKVEDVVRRSKQSSGGYDSIMDAEAPFMKVREGDNQIRILPRTWDDTKTWGDSWEIQVHLHRNVGPDNGTYLCLEKMKGESCPVCEARHEAEGDEADALKPQWRALAWVIDRANEKAGPQVLSLPITFFRDINSKSLDKKTGKVIVIDDEEEGYDVLFTREGAGKRTKYTQVDVDRDPTPVHDNQKRQAGWLDYIEDHALPDMLVYYEPDHIEKVLFGKARKPDEDDEVEDRSARRGRGRGEEEEIDEPRGRKRRGGDDEDEKEDPVPRGRRRAAEPEEEAEEEKPRRTRRTEPEETDKADDEDGASRRRARRGAREEEAEEAESEKEAPRKRRARGEDEDVEEKPARRKRGGDEEPKDDEDEEPTTQARRRLRGLREGRDD